MNPSEYHFLEKTFSKMADLKPVLEASPNFHPRVSVDLKNDLPQNLRSAWQLAVYEAESNTKPCPYGGEYFTAGGRGGWFGMLFGQDTVACGLLAFNKLYPCLMKNQIRSYVLARLNIGFMGLVVPAGDHEIELHYETPGLKAGAICTFGGAAALTVYWMLARRYDAKKRQVTVVDKGNQDGEN